MSHNGVNRIPALRFSSFKKLEQLFGPPPILKGESAEDYLAIGQAIWDARPPEDFIQATRINDIAYLLWEGNRLRRLKVKLIEASKVEGARKLVQRLTGKYRDDAYWSAWALGKQSNVEFVNNLLSAAGLDQEAIVAQTLDVIVNALEGIERQSSQFEARRLVTVRDYDEYSDNIERRREISEARTKQLTSQRQRKTKQENKHETQPSPQLPLDLEAAE